MSFERQFDSTNIKQTNKFRKNSIATCMAKKHIRVGGVETRSSREHNSTTEGTNFTVLWARCQLLIFTPIFLAKKSVAWNERGDCPPPQPRSHFDKAYGQSSIAMATDFKAYINRH